MPYFSKVYDSWEPLQREKYEKILEAIRMENIELTYPVLDIGCGPFYFESFLEERGIDTKEFVCLDIEKTKSRKGFVLGSGDYLPFKPETFSRIFCLDAIHLIENAEEMYDVTKKGGYIVVSMFFNMENLKETQNLLLKKLNKFKILKQDIIEGAENEIIIIGKR